MSSYRHRWSIAATTGAVVAALALTAAPAGASPARATTRTAWAVAPTTVKTPVAIGLGGAVSTVDFDASRAGLEVLRGGGNAADAAVAAAAALGVTEPFSAGLGGGGYFVYYDARRHRVSTVDGRETGPAAFNDKIFVDPATGQPYAFATAVTSGLSVGVPGTPATWQTVARQFGTRSVGRLLQPAIRIAEHGFTVDATFASQVASNAARFARFSSTSALYLPGGQPPAVGSTFRNPDLAATYRQLAQQGIGTFYTGPIASEIAATAQHPPLAPGAADVIHGVITARDIAGYHTILRAPTHVRYRGLDVYGMAPSSSGGTTVGEALNILENVPLGRLDRAQALHYYLEASRRAFADRNRYIGDPAYLGTAGRAAMRQLLTQGFADERFCTIDPNKAPTVTPVPPGSPDGDYHPSCSTITTSRPASGDHEGLSTTHLVTTDRWGNVASYTLTIEQTGGNGMVVPGRGFLLNNEMTDFDFTPLFPGVPDPNLPAAGKRPRSSMSPTIVLRRGRPFIALGSPGGATIITTVLQTLINRIDLGYSLPDAIAAPRASQRNQGNGVADAEPAFEASAVAGVLRSQYGQQFTPNPAEIGAATGLEFLGHGLVLAAAEPVRRGGGSAVVVHDLLHR